MKQLGRSVGRLQPPPPLSLSLSLSRFFPLLHTAALRRSKALLLPLLYTLPLHVSLSLCSSPVDGASASKTERVGTPRYTSPLSSGVATATANPKCARETILLLYHEE